MIKVEAMEKHLDDTVKILEKHSSKLATLYRNCYKNTLDETISFHDDGTCYLLAGDIPAMWMRDSTTQVWNYLKYAKEPNIQKIIKGTILRQFGYITMDPYANAFNEDANGRGQTEDLPKNSPWIWERKYEIDSLAYPIRLLYYYWKESGDDSIIKNEFPSLMRIVLNVWKTEQHHFERSEYRFFRVTDRYNDTIHNNGMGEPVDYTGMTWQGFRPSDDACTYGYNIASNIFAYLSLGYAKEMLATMGEKYIGIIGEIDKLREDIMSGVEKYGIIEHPKYGKMFAYETDGKGNYELMDDANIPSLISLPYIGFNDEKYKEIYANTRKFVLSTDNPYYYVGKYKGLGSPHEYTGYIWHIGLSIQGLTSTDKAEMKEVLQMLIDTDADTGYMHEGFDKDDPVKFTRTFFPWSNSLFCEFVDKCVAEGVIK